MKRSSTPARSRVRDTQSIYDLLVICGIAALLVTSIFFRCWEISSVPGLNGDEAWYGVQANQFWAGDLQGLNTPTGNPLNPFFIIPVIILNGCLGASIAVLRIVPLISGIIMLAVNFVVGRRLFGYSTAVTSTLFLALLPICIAYSRLAWDASQSVLFTLLPLYMCLAALESRRYWLWLFGAGIAQLIASWVHPTNIFSSPIMMLCIVECVTRAADPEVPDRTLAWWRWGFFLLVCMVSGLAFWTSGHHFFEMLAYLRGLIRLFTGATAFEHISGAGATNGTSAGFFATSLFDVGGIVFGLLLLAASIAGFAFGPHRKQGTVLGIGMIVAVAAYFRIGGSAATTVGFERYSIWLIAPAVVFVSLGLQPLLRSRSAVLILLVAGSLTLGSFYCNYFRHFSITGGTAHPAFRTGQVDPKLAAVDFIKANSESTDRILVLTDRFFWIYQPVRYFTLEQWTEVEVMRISDQLDKTEIDLSDFDSVWLITWVEVEAQWRLPEIPASDLDFVEDSFEYPVESLIHDNGGRPLIRIVGRLSKQPARKGSEYGLKANFPGR